MSESNNEEFYVEEIIGKRHNEDGILEYLVKWDGYARDESTWEPLENLNNINNLIDDFEKRAKKFTKEKDPSVNNDKPNKEYDVVYEIGELLPEKVTTVKMVNDELCGLVHWIPRSDGMIKEPNYIPSRILKHTYPKKLIEFYESKIKFVKSK